MNFIHSPEFADREEFGQYRYPPRLEERVFGRWLDERVPAPLKVEREVTFALPNGRRCRVDFVLRRGNRVVLLEHDTRFHKKRRSKDRHRDTLLLSTFPPTVRVHLFRVENLREDFFFERDLPRIIRWLQRPPFRKEAA